MTRAWAACGAISKHENGLKSASIFVKPKIFSKPSFPMGFSFDPVQFCPSVFFFIIMYKTFYDGISWPI